MKSIWNRLSTWNLKLSALLLVGLAALHCAGAPLVLKDDYRSPRNKERPLRKATRLIVLHTTEAHARSSLNKLSERGEAHYCLTEKGEAYRIIDRDREAFHAGRSMWNGKEDCDEYSIGIEVVGYHDKSMPLVQLEALKELVARLKKMYGLADVQVVCHSHVAYGAPNQWHKAKHRGRKRCGMLFAMPSVRAKLGLRARPASDADVRAKRLVVGDPYLNTVLYGGVDTMAAVYGRPQQAVVAAKPVAAKPVPKPVAKPVPKAVAKPVAAKPVVKPAPKVSVRLAPAKPAAPAPAKPVAAKSAPAKPVAAKPVPKAVAAKPAPPPVRRPALVAPPPAAKPPEPQPPPEQAAPAPEAAAGREGQEGRDWLATIGLKGGYFKKRARLVTPVPAVPDPPAASEPPPPSDSAEPAPSDPAPAGGAPGLEALAEEPAPAAPIESVWTEDDPSPVLPLPKNLHVGRMGDDVRDLEALAKLPGYTRGGPVNGENSPFRIAGAAWRLPTTYYYGPRGQITTGDKVDEKSVEAGTFIFFKKQEE